MDVQDRSTYPSNLASLGVEASSRPRTDSRATSSASSTPPPNDFTDLSSAARTVTQAMQMPEVRQDRVTSLQQQIASGGYHVAPQDVADAMLRNLHG